MENIKIDETQTNLIRKEIAEKLYAVIRPLLVEELSSQVFTILSDHEIFIFIAENIANKICKEKWTGLLPIMEELINDLIRRDSAALRRELWGVSTFNYKGSLI